MVRTPSIDERGRKKGAWTVEEDKKLKAYVTRYRSQNWRLIAQNSGLSRSKKSCRLRWMNYLRPNVKTGNYSKEEEDTIIKLHGSLGNKWSMIASHLPRRTDNGIKNHWHGYLKKRVNQNSIFYKHVTTNQEEKKDKPIDSPSVDQQITAQSSSFSPEDSPAESSISTLDTQVTNGTDNISENDIWLEDTILETNGNMWTETFSKDLYYYITPTNYLEPFMNDGLLYQASPVTDYQFMYSADHIYDY